MVYCPACKAEWDAQSTECPICGRDLTSDDADDAEQPWVVLGMIADRISADFARETLRAYEVPAIVVSKAGYFGTAGLTMTHFYSGAAALFEVSVPPRYREVADEILRMAVGERWQRKEK